MPRQTQNPRTWLPVAEQTFFVTSNGSSFMPTSKSKWANRIACKPALNDAPYQHIFAVLAKTNFLPTMKLLERWKNA